MKAWGLVFSAIMVCSACATAEKTSPIGAPLEPYTGPAITVPDDYDRADAGANPSRLNSLVGNGWRHYLASWR